MNIVAWWVKPLIYIALLIFIGTCVAEFISHERALGAAAQDAAYAKGVAEAKDAAAALAQQKSTAVETSHANDLKSTARQLSAGNAARTQLSLLRAQLARTPAAGASAASGPVADDTTVYRGLLDACSVRYEAVAGSASSLALQVVGLQGYVRGLFVGEPNQIEDTRGGPGAANPTTPATPVGERLRAGFIGLVTQPTTELPEPIQVEAAPPSSGASP